MSAIRRKYSLRSGAEIGDPTFTQEERSWLLEDAKFAIESGDLRRGQEVFLRSTNGWYYKVSLVYVTNRASLFGKVYERAFLSKDCYANGFYWIFDVDTPYTSSEVNAFLRKMRKTPVHIPITVAIHIFYDVWS